MLIGLVILSSKNGPGERGRSTLSEDDGAEEGAAVATAASVAKALRARRLRLIALLPTLRPKEYLSLHSRPIICKLVRFSWNFNFKLEIKLYSLNDFHFQG